LIEAIDLDLDYMTVCRLIETSAAPDDVVDDLLRMLIVFLRGEEPEKNERFVETAYRIGLQLQHQRQQNLNDRTVAAMGPARDNPPIQRRRPTLNEPPIGVS
jgi:hypothetical protein